MLVLNVKGNLHVTSLYLLELLGEQAVLPIVPYG